MAVKDHSKELSTREFISTARDGVTERVHMPDPGPENLVAL